MRKVSLFAAVLLVCWASSASAIYKVSVKTTGETTSLEQMANLYFTHLLNKLPDVVVDDDDPDFSFYALVFTTEVNNGTVTGYAMSTVGLSLWPASSLAVLFVDNPEYKNSFINHGEIVHHLLVVGGRDGLVKLCQESVDAFEINAIQPRRRLKRESGR
jgi:hypothetical protein